MKKFICLLLAAVLCVSLVACGEKNTGNTTEEQPEAEGKSNAESIALGDTIDLDYVTMTLDAFEVSTGYSFESTDASSGISITHKSSIDCPSDMKLVCLRGKFTNKATGDIFPANNPAHGELVINGYTYKTKMKCYISDSAESAFTVSPLRTVDYYIYAEVPPALTDAIEECTLTLGFVNNLDSSKPVFEMSDNDVLYALEAIPAQAN